MTTPLGQAVQFLKDFGLFDVVLPFLLVFSIVFAILEKTMILGSEKVGDKTIPKRTINTMVAFVVGMIVIAMNEVVNAINEALPNVVLLLVILISFLMLVGTLYKQGEFSFTEKHPGWTMAFIIIIFILIVLIFINSIYLDNGMSWLDWLLDKVFGTPGVGSPAGAAIIFLIIILAGVVYITRGKGEQKDK
jgi:hypothetical protein